MQVLFSVRQGYLSKDYGIFKGCGISKGILVVRELDWPS